MERSNRVDLIIIGAGPAGLAASVYASRAGLSVMILEEGAPGGKLTKTHLIDNYPGVGELKGFELANNMFTHGTSFGAKYTYGSVVKVEDHGEYKEVICADGNHYESRFVLLATGTRERLLNIPGEKENVGKGVSYCAVCDGGFFKDKTVAVIGGGNSAVDESLYLTKFVKKLYIIIRRDIFRADESSVAKLKANDKIEVIRKHIPKAINTNGEQVSSIELENVDTKEKMTVDVDGVFPYIGADPITDCVRDLGVCDDDGYVIVDDYMRTRVKGLYAAGDVIQKHLRQVVTATSDGAIAAQAIVEESDK